MNQAEKDQLVSMFTSHLDQIQGLQPYNFQGAEALYQRTKMFAEKYYPARGYGVELVGIKFRPTSVFFESPSIIWEIGITKLLSIAQAMLDDTALTPITVPRSAPAPTAKVVEDTTKVDSLQNEVTRLKNELQRSQTDLSDANAAPARHMVKLKLARKYSVYVIAFLLSSLILWTFNSWVKWSWLRLHPKKTALYLSVQVLLFLTLTLPLLKADRVLKFTVVGGMVVAVLVGLLQLI